VLRFHLDEHVNHAIARALASRGIDVTTTANVGLLGASDEEHLELARREERICMTHDADFLAIAAQSVEHAGIAYCAPSTRSVGHIVRYLCLMSDCLEQGEMAGRVEFL
jgi:predicted nuclease of predicted toxin-antitoxin system